MNGKRGSGGSNSRRPAPFLAGLLLGILIGAAAMFLLAPRSGKKSRAQIQKQGEKMRTQATAVMDDVVTGASDKAHQFTDSVQQGVGDLEQHAQDMLSDSKKKKK